jgi:hypothetical protein
MTGLPADAYLVSVVPEIYEGDLYGAAVFQEIAAAEVEEAIEEREYDVRSDAHALARCTSPLLRNLLLPST